MLKEIVRFIFFGNYFVGLLAVALNIESGLQLHHPIETWSYYLLIFLLPVLYYSYAYLLPGRQELVTANVRSQWYMRYRRFMRMQLYVGGILALGISAFLFLPHIHRLSALPLYFFIVLLMMLALALSYYGFLPQALNFLNVRKQGWLKAFAIGFMWACMANLLPLIYLYLSDVNYTAEPGLWIWLFIKNWMFCAVNAVLFDVKDYPDDANRSLKTFVVRYGLRRTLFQILIPLLGIGATAFFIFAIVMEFRFWQIAINLLPYLATIAVAYSLRKRQSILYYLIIIDGVVFFKAICGIMGVYLLS